MLAVLLMLVGIPHALAQHEVASMQHSIAKLLTNNGFMNVRCAEDEQGIICTIENDEYKVEALGIRHAIELISQDSTLAKKPCTLIVLKNNVPQVAVKSNSDLNGWDVTYDLPDGWKERLKGKEKANSSLFKTDVVVYPQVMFASYVINSVYWYAFELAPAIQMQLWPGARMVAQVVIPVLNDRYYDDMKVVPGSLVLQQNFRLPGNIRGRASLGYFSQASMGGQMELYYPLPVLNDHVALAGKMAYVERGYFSDLTHFYYRKQEQLCYSFGPDLYWKQMNSQLRLRCEKYLKGETGFRAEALFHYRYSTFGFYAVRAKGIKTNLGFEFTVSLPPNKSKRHGYGPRLTTGDISMGYNASNDEAHYKFPMATMDDNIMTQNAFNVSFIKSQIDRK